MNKNIVKGMVLGAIIALSALFISAPATSSAAPAPGGSSNSPTKYLGIPLSYSRTKPVTEQSTNCDLANANRDAPCIDITSGIGIYNYVGSAKASTPNIKSLTIVDKTVTSKNGPDSTAGIYNNYNNFVVVDGVLRIAGLTVGHEYSVSFTYDDAQSSDIKSLVGQVKKYCDDPMLQQKSGEATAFNIVHSLADGCGKYNSQPFLPGTTQVVVPATGTVNYRNNVTTIAAVNIQAPTPTGDSSGGGGNSDNDTCPVKDGEPLRWLMCPVLGMMDDAVTSLQKLIQGFLYTPTEQIFGNDGFMETAKAFRNLGIALVVIAGLVMVISQASGLDFIDAYTVRKLLPRLIVALIGIVLAMPLLELVVTIFNDLGVWMSDLISSTVKVKGGLEFGTLITAGSFLAGGAFYAAVITLGTTGIGALLLTIVLALLVGLLVLAVRQMVILVCVLLAPLAIAAYVLPGTQKLWEFWKGAFITAMTIFPIIMLFLASGKALATVLSATGSTELQLLSIVVYFAPFFLLPFAFKLAGGLMSTIFSIANDPARGGFDRLKKYRQENGARRRQDWRQGQLYNESNKLGNLVNRSGRRVNSIGARRGNFGFGARGRAVREGQQQLASMEFEKNNQMFGAYKEDDKVMSLLARNSNEKAARAWINRTDSAGNHVISDAERAQWEQSLQAARAIGFGSTSRRAALMSGANIGYGLDAGQEGWTQATRAMKEIAGMSADTSDVEASKNLAYRNMVNEFQYRAKGFGRADLSGGTDGAPEGYNGDRAWKSVSLYQQANGKATSIKGSGVHYAKKFRLGSTKEKVDAAVFYKELEAMLPNATGGVRDEILKQRKVLEDEGILAFMAQGTGATTTRRVRDPSAPGGFIDQTIDETYGDQAQKAARIYERPDPNRMVDS